jgi:integrase
VPKSADLNKRSNVIRLPNGGGLGHASINPTKQEVHYESFSRYRLLGGVSQIALKKNTIRTYESTLSNFRSRFADRDLVSVSPDDVLSFLTAITEGKKQLTKRTRYSHLKTFFNFIKNNMNENFQNPCDTPMLRKLFRAGGATPWNVLEKEVVDEIIFRTTKSRNRLMLELMARGGMRISEVLKLTPDDIEDRKLTLRDPKSGKEREVVYIPRKIADRLRRYIRDQGIGPDQSIFPITYTAARAAVKKAGTMVGIHLRPHDLRRHAATSHRDCEQGDFEACKSSNNATLSWQSQRR